MGTHTTQHEHNRLTAIKMEIWNSFCGKRSNKESIHAYEAIDGRKKSALFDSSIRENVFLFVVHRPYASALSCKLGTSMATTCNAFTANWFQFDFICIIPVRNERIVISLSTHKWIVVVCLCCWPNATSVRYGAEFVLLLKFDTLFTEKEKIK